MLRHPGPLVCPHPSAVPVERSSSARRRAPTPDDAVAARACRRLRPTARVVRTRRHRGRTRREAGWGGVGTDDDGGRRGGQTRAVWRELVRRSGLGGSGLGGGLTRSARPERSGRAAAGGLAFSGLVWHTYRVARWGVVRSRAPQRPGVRTWRAHRPRGHPEVTGSAATTDPVPARYAAQGCVARSDTPECGGRTDR